MSTKHVYLLTCDEPGCTEVFAGELPRAWETRDEAAKLGWTYRVPEREVRIGPVKSVDLCPRHSP